jgi:hypothetical protein
MDTPMSSGFGTSSGTDSGIKATRAGVCPHCGQPANTALDQFLGRLGIDDEMIHKLKTSMEKVDVEEYLATAREYLKNGSEKATTFAKENPGKVAAGVAVLAVGAGLLLSALNRE